jgi:signal transduction histidine kinase
MASEQKHGKRWRWYWWFARLSLRSRLIAAFLILIVSSAGATIVIGNLVFGSKVVELASSRVEVGLKVAQLYLSSHLERMKVLARVGRDELESGVGTGRFCSSEFWKDGLVDVAVLVHPGAAEVLRPVSGAGEGNAAQPGCAARPCAAAFSGTSIEGFAGKSTDPETPFTGLLSLRREAMAELGFDPVPAEGMLLAAGIRLTGGRTLVLLAMLNGRTELVSIPVGLLWPDRDRSYAATLFLRDARVATTVGEEALGTRVDPRVVEKVLEGGETYVGQARVLDRQFYAAYMPLSDYSGAVIGMLGLGAEAEVYVDVRNRTVTLFSSLIAAGMLFGFVISYLFSWWLIRPVTQLAEGMHRVAQGELDHKVRFRAADELGRLASAFNLMVKAVRERDFRLREMTEERLTHVEKQVSIGRLAAGVAHEINNPLTAILSLSMLMQKHLPPDDERREDLDVIVEEANRCRAIVRALLDFARERPVENRVVPINQVIRDTLTLVRNYDALDGIQIVQALSQEPLEVNVDAKQIQQVFINLVVNAAEASSKGQSIRITTDEDSSGAYVVTRVIDSGKGIPREHQQRVFEPFFTTKGSRRGTGLGLSVSQGIVRKHNGSVEISSVDGEGTTVTVLLPRAAEPDGSPATGA